MKDTIKQIDIYKGIRKVWEVKPIMRIQKNGKRKSRAQIKNENIKNGGY